MSSDGKISEVNGKIVSWQLIKLQSIDVQKKFHRWTVYRSEAIDDVPTTVDFSEFADRFGMRRKRHLILHVSQVSEGFDRDWLDGN